MRYFKTSNSILKRLTCMSVYKSFVSLALICLCLAPHRLACKYSYKSYHTVYGSEHTDIERAGVMLLKDYGSDLMEKDDRYAVLLGYCKDLKKLSPYAGGVSKKDKYSSECAARELKEETGGYININPKYVAALPYICSDRKQLFFHRDDSLSERKISKACQRAQESSLPWAYKEMSGCFAVSVKEFLRLASTIDSGRSRAVVPSNSMNNSLKRKEIRYALTTRDGKQLSIVSPYMNMFGNIYNHSLYANAKLMFEDIFRVSF